MPDLPGRTYLEVGSEVTVGADWTVMWAPLTWLALYPCKLFSIINTGSNPFTALSMESSPDNLHWEVRNSTGAPTLAAGGVFTKGWSFDMTPYWRVRAKAAVAPGDTTAKVYFYSWWP